MSRPLPTFVSEAEFLALPESMDHIELIDGEVIVSPAPSYGHQEVLGRLVLALRLWARARPAGEEVVVGQSPLDVRFGEGRILQPDAFVLFGHLARDHEGPIDRVPALCVEVLSRDRVYDRVTKRAVYATAGVREYWTVHPAGLIERWTGPNLPDRDEVGDLLTTPLLPGFELSLPELFGP